MKKYLKSLFITLCYFVSVTIMITLFIMMSGNFFRFVLAGLVIFIFLPVVYQFLIWLLND